ncbi:hypothetical protein BGZ95_011456 [Linnemannia exigua]|uniref:Uncharacterized protein n=1 Tax=Linnemannia exigua TaxID=604196 RepID=A0AAD4DBP2_9FUNG|nr:hypothetical protein BGZ95_011456 [Linnemannia exigua]
MDNDNEHTDNTNEHEPTSPDIPSPSTTVYNDIIAAYSFCSSTASAFDSRLSRSSTSSSISGWAPRARSSSVSSHGSNDSVNLDALIAGGSDINEECPLELEDGDDMVVDWSKEDQLQQQQLLDDSDEHEQLPTQVQQGQRSRRSTGASASSSMFHDDRQSDDYWDEPELAGEDPEFDETLKGFPQLSMKMSIPAVRGLTSPKQPRAPATGSSNRFPDGRNPFDLDADYMDTPSGLTSPSPSNNRLSTLSQDSSISNRSSISSIGGSRLQPPGVSRLPGAPGTSGLKAPASRLAQPGSRTATGVPQPASRTGIARPGGLQAPKSGLQAPKSGLQAPKTGLQAPKASGLQAPRTGSSSSLVKPSATGARTGVVATGSRLVAPGSRVPSKPGSGIAPPSATRSQIAAPGTVKRAASVSTGGRSSSTLLPPSTVTSRSASSSSLTARSGSTTAPRTLTNPQRASTSTPTHLTSPTRGVPSGRLSSASSYMISPTSSQSSTSSLPSLGHAKDTVTPLSQRLSNATGTSQLMRPKASVGGIPAPRSLSMYGSSSSLLPTSGRISQQQQHHYHGMEDEADYAVLTPPQSPSSKRVSSNGNGYGNGSSGVPRSGMAMPSRLAAPSVSTSRVPRSSSPAPLSTGSNAGSSYLLRPHTPTTGLSATRIPSGLVSPRAGRS